MSVAMRNSEETRARRSLEVSLFIVRSSFVSPWPKPGDRRLSYPRAVDSGSSLIFSYSGYCCSPYFRSTHSSSTSSGSTYSASLFPVLRGPARVARLSPGTDGGAQPQDTLSREPGDCQPVRGFRAKMGAKFVTVGHVFRFPTGIGKGGN